MVFIKLLFSALLAVGIMTFTPPDGSYRNNLGRNAISAVLIVLLLSMWAAKGFVIMMAVLLGGGLMGWWLWSRGSKRDAK